MDELKHLLQSSKQDAKILKTILQKSSIVIKDCMICNNYERLYPLVKNIDRCLNRLSIVTSAIDDNDNLIDNNDDHDDDHESMSAAKDNNNNVNDDDENDNDNKNNNIEDRDEDNEEIKLGNK